MPPPESDALANEYEYRLMVQTPPLSGLDLGSEEGRYKGNDSVTTDQQPTFHLDLCSLISTLNIWLYWKKERYEN